MGKGRSLIVILAAIAGVVLTLRLGWWQLSRADEKIQYQSQLEAQMQLPPLDTSSLQQNPEQWLNVHRRVEL
jgi:surfeit locus 1 family protein